MALLQVTINVLDENDNAPVLVRDMFEVSHPENIQVGTTLISLLASDPDLSENGTINFTMVGDDTRGFASPSQTHSQFILLSFLTSLLFPPPQCSNLHTVLFPHPPSVHVGRVRCAT